MLVTPRALDYHPVGGPEQVARRAAGDAMVKRFDHVTVAVRDVDQARAFFHLLGFNHICFAVDDIEAEVAKLRAHGVRTRNEIMDFHLRKLVFLEGPEGITVELSQWHK